MSSSLSPFKLSPTAYIAGRKILASQRPFMEADRASAKLVLDSLLAKMTYSTVASVDSITPVIQEIEV